MTLDDAIGQLQVWADNCFARSQSRLNGPDDALEDRGAASAYRSAIVLLKQVQRESE